MWHISARLAPLPPANSHFARPRGAFASATRKRISDLDVFLVVVLAAFTALVAF